MENKNKYTNYNWTIKLFQMGIENNVVRFIEENYSEIEHDMNQRNSTAKNKTKDKILQIKPVKEKNYQYLP